MGIPKYFRHIATKYPSVVINTNTKVQINNLYFDMNCLIHPCVRNVTQENAGIVNEHKKLEPGKKYQTDHTFVTKFEQIVYEEIELYLNKLLLIANPDKLVYLAIDGVAPRAKMEQQRVRRFRSIKISKYESDIHTKHGVSKAGFDTNCITPGTIFMYKLSVFLNSYCERKFKELNIDFILDDCQNKGEGEHKILQHIKNNTSEDVGCIYGLDADLIMLSLCTGSEIYLLREDIHFGKVDMSSFLYLDIKELGDHLYNEIKADIMSKPDTEELVLERQNIINDYICLCFLIGNDFLPHLNGIDILTNSINDLLNIYISIIVIRHKHLVIDNSINFIFIRQILTYLFANEKAYLPKFQNKLNKFRPRLNYNNNMELELEKLKFYPCYHHNNSVVLGKGDWMDKYYDYYFNIKNVVINSADIDAVCSNYIDGLQWNIKYYLDECPSYSWYYHYRAGPCLRELCRFLINRVYPVKFDTVTEFSPLEQLSIVLPIQSRHLWAGNFNRLVNNDLKLLSYYPTDFKLDTLNHKFLYECDPILPDNDHDYIQTCHAAITLSEFEEKRNKKTGVIKYIVPTNQNIKLVIE